MAQHSTMEKEEVGCSAMEKEAQHSAMEKEEVWWPVNGE